MFKNVVILAALVVGACLAEEGLREKRSSRGYEDDSHDGYGDDGYGDDKHEYGYEHKDHYKSKVTFDTNSYVKCAICLGVYFTENEYLLLLVTNC